MRKRVLTILLNPYVFSITLFVVWMTFFDRYSYMNLREIRAKVDNSKEELQWYTEQIEEVREDREQLNSSLEQKERFAREHFHMKAEHEIVFLTE
ncbi:MAG: FtsB family cell division protein [Chitinophagales bacterium]